MHRHCIIDLERDIGMLKVVVTYILCVPGELPYADIVHLDQPTHPFNLFIRPHCPFTIKIRYHWLTRHCDHRIRLRWCTGWTQALLFANVLTLCRVMFPHILFSVINLSCKCSQIISKNMVWEIWKYNQTPVPQTTLTLYLSYTHFYAFILSLEIT